ncbi:MAG: ferritin-like domain-containing protein [Actinomycetota bacterium]|nr:ferritin-like domain-containing protein [Actinomycetota bacterium]
MTDHNEMQISEAELVAMTAGMEEMHQATMPIMRASMLDLGNDLRKRGSVLGAQLASRRAFLAGGSAVVGGLLLTACGSSDKKAGGSVSPSTGSSSPANADIAALSTDASIEALAIFAYDAALKAAPMGKFGKTVPAAVATFATVAKKQHEDHLAAFNAAITQAGGTAFTKPDPALAPTVTKLFGDVTNVVDLAKLAITLENTAAATYIQQMAELTSPAALAAVATIAPVEQQHSAILYFVIGEYPVPDTFVKLGKTATSLGARPSNEAGA